MVVIDRKAPIADYAGECVLRVGQRVEVDLEYVPIVERDVTTGCITDIQTRFPRTASHRKIRVTVQFDGHGSYIKEGFAIFGGIEGSITLDGFKKLKAI